MSVGLQVDKAILDSQAGRLALDLRNTLEAVARLQTWMAATTDAELVDLGYTPAEVAVLKSAVSDMNDLVLIAKGTLLPTEARSYFAFARRLLGIN